MLQKRRPGLRIDVLRLGKGDVLVIHDLAAESPAFVVGMKNLEGAFRLFMLQGQQGLDRAA